MTVSESLLQISNLTKQNLQILQMLNDSFYTKSNHLSTIIGDTAYTIPSYIALENKVNHIQDAFNNLVHAARAGEAWFNFDGNSKEIAVRGYQHAPNPINLKLTNYFGTETKFPFKDLLTPQPYLNFDMSELPDDVNKVIVKKLIPYNRELQTKLIMQGSKSVEVDGNATAHLSWPQVVKCLESGSVEFVEGIDYLAYETIYDLPIRQNIRFGNYVIEEVVSDKINKDLENVIELKIHKATPLHAFDQDGITESDLQAGDVLVSWDGSAKLKIRTIKPAARTIEVLVMSGEYVNAIGAGDLDMEQKELIEYVSDYSKLRLYSSITDNRSIHVPLEEDKYVFIAVAPLNVRLNTRSEWGQGVLVNVNQLHLEDSKGDDFRSYYNQNVQNIGDAIIEFSNLAYPAITKFSPEEMAAMLQAPELSDKTLQVVQINKHLNDSEAVRNIRSLYAQKKQYQTDLLETQTRIQTLNDELHSISFDDMSGTRSAITAQITDLKAQQNNLITSINKITESIANSANNAEIPIEAAKYRVRGYLDVDSFVAKVHSDFNVSEEDKKAVYNSISDNVLGIQVQYRYKNPDIPQANVSVVDNFLFTEWVLQDSQLRERYMKMEDNKYVLNIKGTETNANGYKKYKKTENEVKFNQIDIPISQGEIVEVRTRVIWGFGYPYVTTSTDWSEPIEITFPPELVKDVQVTTIIEENNDDIETNRFNTVLKEAGVTDHINDKFMDQDVTFYHRPESVSSGFYTPERRVIPLKDKLLQLSNDLVSVQDMLMGSYASSLRISFICDNVENELQPDVQNVIQLPAYNAVQELDKEIPTGSAYNKDGVVYITGQIKIKNITKHTIRLFPIYPGPRDMYISELKKKKWAKPDEQQWLGSDITVLGSLKTQMIIWPTSNQDADGKVVNENERDKIVRQYEQRANQVITYCRANPFNGDSYMGLLKQLTYSTDHDETGHWLKEKIDAKEPMGLSYYPMAISKYGMCLESDAVSANKELAPDESLVFPIFIEYMLDQNNLQDSKVCGFSIRNSLYQDPLYYEFLLVAKYNQSTADQLVAAKNIAQTGTKYNIVVR